MIKSLRWRLQIWYTGLLMGVVGGFGGILYYQVYTSKWHEIDTQLESTALYLDATLRSFPPAELDGKDRPPPFAPPFGKEKKGPKGGRPKDQLLADLALPRELKGPEKDRPYFTVRRWDGSVLKTTGVPADSRPIEEADAFSSWPRITQRGEYREVWLRGPQDSRIVVGRSVAKEWGDLRGFALQLIGIGLAVLIAGMAGGYWITLRIVRPITRMAATASSISATNLSARIDAGQVDVELAELAKVLNAMFDRLEAAFARQRQFTADASHELRTPLAILRANAELALSQARSPEEYRQTLDTCLRAANRMNTLVQSLLTLARGDAGNPGLRLQPVQFEQVLTDCLTSFQPLARGKEITLTADLRPASVNGDAESLTQLISNLLNNAIKYNHPGGSVHVQLGISSGEVVLTVTNTGPGIPEQARHRIFERFFRADKSRARASGGTGLGLAICKVVVEAHGGSLDFESQPNQKTTFRVRIPQSQSVASV